MIPPAAPVIPGYEDRRLRPQTSLHDGIHLVDRPLHSTGHVFNRMLAEPGRRVNPRNRRQLPRSRVLRELRRRKFWPPAKRLKHFKGVSAVVAPTQTRGVETCRQRRQVEDGIPARVLDYR